jgi:hypothetical protein
MSPRAPDFSLVPNRFRGEMTAYFLHGKAPRSLALIAVLSNNLKDSLRLVPTSDLLSLVTFLQEDCPAPMWGSPERVNRWMLRGGLSASPVSA